ncbi:MAG: helix-turn-helix domain-containing protein [Nocardioides sp.]
MTSTTTLALAGVRALSPADRRAIRSAAGLSLNDVARGVGCSPSTVGQWEKGARRPSGHLGERYGMLLQDLDRLSRSEETP